MDDSEYAREMLGNLRPIYPPGMVHVYHAVTWGPLVREIVLAAAGKGIREILADEILDPLGFRWTNYGVAPQDVPLVAPSHPTGKPLPPPIAAAFRLAVGGTIAPDHPLQQHARVPHRRRAVVEYGVQCRRAVPVCRDPAPRRRTRWRSRHEAGDLENRDGTGQAPSPRRRDGVDAVRWGTGYMLGSKRFGPFGRDEPAAFGNTGLVNIAAWADPERELSAAIVSSGKPGGHREAKRYPALLDAIAAGIPRV